MCVFPVQSPCLPVAAAAAAAMSASDSLLQQLLDGLSLLPALLSRRAVLYQWQAQVLLGILVLRLLYQRVHDPILEMRLWIEQMDRPRCSDCCAWIRRACRLRTAPPAVLHSAAARVSPAEHAREQSATTAEALAALRRDPRYRFRMSEIAADPVSTSGGNWQHGRFAQVNLLGDPAFDEEPVTEAQRNRVAFAAHLKHTLCEWTIVFLLGRIQAAFGAAASSSSIRVPFVAGVMMLLFPLAPMVWRRCFTPTAYGSNAARFRAPAAPLWRRVLAMLIDRSPILIHAALSRGGKMMVGQLTLAILTLCTQALLCFPVHPSLGARLLDLQFVRMPSGEVDRRWVAVLAWLWIDVLRFCLSLCAFLVADRTILIASLVLCVAELAFLLVRRRSLMEGCCKSKVIVAASPAADEYEDRND